MCTNQIEITIKRNLQWDKDFNDTTENYKKPDWLKDNNILEGFVKGKDIASFRNGHFSSQKYNESVFEYLRDKSEIIKKIQKKIQIDTPNDLENFIKGNIKDFQEGFFEKLDNKRYWLVIHAMICALNPDFFCNIVNEDRLDELYKKLFEIKEKKGVGKCEELKKNEEQLKTEYSVIKLIFDLSKLNNEFFDCFKQNNDNISWYKKSFAINKFFVDNSADYKDIAWATLNALKTDDKVDNLTNRLKIQKNIILTGAPGTGKTYLAREIAKQMILTEDLISKDLISKIESSDDDNIEELKNKILNSYINKTDLDKEFKNYSDIDKKKEFLRGIIYKEQIEFVQFHPSYDYSDFVEGLRPTMEGDTVAFKRMDGTFKSFCEKAAKKENEDKYYIFIIDEINRGEISKIFGELFFSIDPGYRDGGKDKIYVKTQYHKMIENELQKKAEDDITDYPFKEGFFVPNNVYIIGTMNDIDRSVDSMDFAFRRRFAFVEITADDSEAIIYNNEKLKDKPDIFNKLINSMHSLNKAIIDPQKGGLSTEYQIGGAYFLKITDVDYDYERLWNEYIKGVLIEYFRGNPKQKEILAQLEEAYNCG